MIVLNEHLHKTISSILETVSAVDAFLNEHKELSADHLQQVSYCCAELALLSLTAHDELDDDDGDGLFFRALDGGKDVSQGVVCLPERQLAPWKVIVLDVDDNQGAGLGRCGFHGVPFSADAGDFEACFGDGAGDAVVGDALFCRQGGGFAGEIDGGGGNARNGLESFLD